MKTDYRSYHLSLAETIGCFIVYLIFSAIISLLFYNSFIPVAVFAPFGFCIRKLFQDYRRKQRQKRLYLEFKDMVQALSASLGAGYAFENAFSAAYEEMRKLYGNSGLIVSELKIIIRGIRLNETIEDLLKDFGERSGVQDIVDFAQVVAVAKRTGGNMIHIMKATAANISQKTEVELEIETLVAAKRYEQKIMMVVPFFILAYLRVANRGYLDILYECIAGRIVMTICLAVSAVSFVWSSKIIRIGV